MADATTIRPFRFTPPRADQTTATQNVPGNVWNFTNTDAEGLANQPALQDQSSYAPFARPMVAGMSGQELSALSYDPYAETQATEGEEDTEATPEPGSQEEKDKATAKAMADESFKMMVNKVPKAEGHHAAMKLIDPNYVAPKEINFDQYKFTDDSETSSTQSAPSETTSNASMPNSFALKTAGGVKG